MKYEVTRACIIKGTNHKVGQVVELDDQLASHLMGIGRVVPADESKLEDRSVGLEVSESKPKRRSRKKADPAPEEVVEEIVEESEGDE